MIIVVFSLFLLVFSIGHAKDYGAIGQTFPVVEENLKTVLERKLTELPEEEIKKKITHAIQNPKPLPLKEARKKKTFPFDPSYTAPETITDLDGEIIVQKGESINPLSLIRPTCGMLFFDGSNPRHISWAESQTGEFLWVLTKGKPLQLEKEKGRPIYFDQGGKLTEQLQIRHIPCRVTAKTDHILIEEIPLHHQQKQRRKTNEHP